MCGIAGIVGNNDPGRLRERIESMMAVMSHRGPDDEGAWFEETGVCGLGHKRLSIIDPEHGHQPLSNQGGSLWIVFNGCIYNYADVAHNLRQRGHHFSTHSDTEVIVHAYEEWGPDCVHHFNGMWAFAVWDDRHKSLFCSRDRLGIKPFYYVWQAESFAFASEIKALLPQVSGPVEPDLESLRQYLTFQFCLGEATLFKGIRKLEPGHNLLLKPGQAPQITRYWDVSFQIDFEHNEKYFVERLEGLLQDSVRLRLRSDVPLGAHLSGGLDSSTVVCRARPLLGDSSLKVFCGGFDEGSDFNETPYAKAVAEAAGVDYHEILIGPSEFRDSIEKVIWQMDEPAAGPGVFPQYWVSKLAAEHVKVVLGGQGGDEIFIGYARYLVAYLEECIKGAVADTADRADYVATLGSIVPNLRYLQNYVPMLRSFWKVGLFEEPARRYFQLMDRFSGVKRLLADDLTMDTARTFEEFQATFNVPGAAAMTNRMLYFDLKTHLQSLLHVEDRTSMAWGLESRVPLLDHRLIELMSSIPPVVKFRNGEPKYLFRKAIGNLVPRQVLERTDKMGFPVPLHKWFKNELKDFVSDILLSRSSCQRGLFDPAALETALASELPFSRAIWGALCLEIWYRQFID